MFLLDISIQYRVFIGISAMLLLFSSFLVAFISNQRKKLQYHKKIQAVQESQQQALKQQNALLEERVSERTAELTNQKQTLEHTLTDLKASQLRLVQKEKMASLGELTAGIAHEIQNPLNFVNNFSDINSELITEIKERLAEESLPESLTNDINPIFDDLTQNLHKILQHGKRADGIVKSMLQHSQVHTGEMELADLNSLADEYLKLSFYGFRSKNKGFNCRIQTSFDKDMEPIQVIPQEIGRLLVNIYNNAFYAMNAMLNEPARQDKKNTNVDYEPVLQVTTNKQSNNATIRIRDNGTGIPQKFIEKIFHPFFTTKPTGGSTGLGLSLSYDIIKAHQAKITVDSKEGEYTEFVIELNC
ncbi:MAG: ATP-binding protein [Ferruginibacter sp.]